MAKADTGPLSIHNEMRQFDLKNRDFYDSLSEEEKRKFSPYLMIRWGSAVGGSSDMQSYYLLSTNQKLNRRFFEISAAKHKKLQWLLATTVSPDMGVQRHSWIAPRKREPAQGSRQKILAELFPHLKPDEVELLAKLNSKQDIDDYVEKLGQQ